MTRVRPRTKPSPTRIDADWPHQVALPDDICCQPNFELIMKWFHDHGVEQMTRHVRAIWHAGKEETWRLHCFRLPADAEAFRAHFGGVAFDPKKDRENGRARGPWRRTGEWRRITESGPMKIHPIFLRDAGNLEHD